MGNVVHNNDNIEEDESLPQDEASESTPKIIKVKNYLTYRYEFRYNIIANSLECRTKEAGKNKSSFQELNENDLICELLEAGFNGIDKLLVALLKSSKFVPRYDPFDEYFKQLPPWKEGEPDYIEQLANHITARDQARFNLQFKKALVRSVACALNMIPFNKHCFTLIGKQNDGKSSFIRYLCPPALADYIKEDLTMDKFGRFSLAQNFIINLDELANLSKFEIDQVKKLFTLDKIKERVPFDKKDSIFTRRASFWGSTNKTEFLTDETGSVRWLCFEIDNINFEYSNNINIDLVYAQAYALLRSNFDFKLTNQELQENDLANKKYQVVTNEMNLIVKFYRPATKEKNHAFYTSTDMLRALNDKTNNTLKLNIINIGKALKVLGFEKSEKYIKELGYTQQGYYIYIVDNPSDYMIKEAAEPDQGAATESTAKEATEPDPGITTERIPEEHLPPHSVGWE